MLSASESTLNLGFSGSEDVLLSDEEYNSDNPLNEGVCCVVSCIPLIGVYTGTPEEDELVDLAADLDELVLLVGVVVLCVLAILVFLFVVILLLDVDLLLNVVVLLDVGFLLALVAMP